MAMVKKTRALLITSIALLMLCTVIFAKTYPDVTENTPVYDAVDYLSDMGVISGYEDGLFKPDGEITRGEAAALLARSMGFTDEYEAIKLPFTDVKAGYWAEKFISYCYEIGLINGMTEDTYCPADKVTYGQIVKMLVCASGLEGEVTPVNGGKWYEGYILTAQNQGILQNVTIDADLPAPRGDVAVLVYNCFDQGLMGEAEEEVPEAKPDDSNDENADNEDNENNDAPAVTAPEAKPEPVAVDKNDVTYEAYVKEDYEFAIGLDYTPILAENDVDFSGIDGKYTEESLLIVIDAGHNFSGTDVGAHNETYDVWEQNITFPIAEMLRQKLEMMGFEVVMTRDTYNTNVRGGNVKESLLNRAGIANGLDADLFISIHANAGGGKGVETYCFKAGTKAEALATCVQEYLAQDTPLYDRGVKTANFVVIKETLMPAILVETAFIDTEKDFEFLISRDGQNKLSTAIAKGVLDYVSAKDED